VRLDERIARELRRYTPVVFGLIGQDTMRLAAFAADSGIQYVAARHETAAVSMAAGFARAAGTVGVAFASRGPGLSNALSGIIAAAKAHAAVLVMTGDDPTSVAPRSYDPKGIDQLAMLEAAGVSVVRLLTAERALADIRAAFQQAAGGTAVVVLIPLDVLEADSINVSPASEDLPDSLTRDPPTAGVDDIRAAADALEARSTSGVTLLLAGRGASTHARPALERLGDLTGALMGTTLQAKSLFDRHNRNVGIIGSLGRPDLAELLADVAVVISAGASLNPFTTWRGRLLRSAHLVQIDLDTAAFGRYVPVNTALHGDASRVVSDLSDELDRRSFRVAPPPAPTRLLPLSAQAGTCRATEDRGVDPHLLMQALDRVLPADRAVVVDAGHQLTFACQHLHVDSPEAFIFHDAFQCIGIGLATAIGVAFAQPARTTVASIGDGSFMMSCGDLDTAIRHGLRLVAIVMNDGGFGAERHYLDMLGIDSTTALFRNPPFDQMARAMGARAIAVRELADIEQLARALSTHELGPIVVDCHIDPSVRSEWLSSNLRRGPG
jgi:acetolactate synthase-1/2/3 large subunit